MSDPYIYLKEDPRIHRLQWIDTMPHFKKAVLLVKKYPGLTEPEICKALGMTSLVHGLARLVKEEYLTRKKEPIQHRHTLTKQWMYYPGPKAKELKLPKV